MATTLTALTDTTTFSEDYVVKWAKFELYKYLYEHDPTTLDPNKRPITSPWLRKAISARRAADGSAYSPKLENVVGRR